MKSLVFVGSRQLEIQDTPDPVLRDGSVVLRVVRAGVCGSDVHGYEGSNGRRFPGQIMGHEALGVVVEAPESESHLLGKTMTFTPIISCGECRACLAGHDNRCSHRKLIGVEPSLAGAFAEKVLVPIANLTEWGEESPEVGTLVEPLSVVWRAVSAMATPEPERMLVLGAGTIGALGAILLKDRFNCQVDIYDPLSWKTDWLTDHGVEVMEPGATTDNVEANKYDYVMDCVGSSKSLATSIEQVRPGGQVHMVGMATPEINFPLQSAVSKEVTVTASYAYSRQQFLEATEIARRIASTLQGMSMATCSLQEAPEEIDKLLDPGGLISKLVISP